MLRLTKTMKDFGDKYKLSEQDMKYQEEMMLIQKAKMKIDPQTKAEIYDVMDLILDSLEASPTNPFEKYLELAGNLSLMQIDDDFIV